MNMVNAKDWNDISSVYTKRILTTDLILYPAALPASVKGKKVLDVGCGAGHFSKLLQDHGAQVIGIDSSMAMIKTAKELYPSVEFHHLAVQELEQLKHRDFDYVIAIMVFLCFDKKQEIEKSFKSIAHKLARDGEFVFIDLHPCGKRSFDTSIVKQVFPAKSYFKSGVPFETTLTNEAGDSFTFFNYHWLLEDYAELLKKAHFAITSLRELKPEKASIKEHPALKPFSIIPQYLAIHAKKTF